MRRLPVINSTAPEDDAAAARPRWQWILIGAGFTAVFWIPLALLSLAALQMGGAATLLLVVEYAVAAAGAGAVMGHFARRLGPADAAGAAVLCAALLAAMGAAGTGVPGVVLLSFLVLAPVGAIAAYLGARRSLAQARRS